MYELFLFLMIFFAIIGVIRVINITYAFFVKTVSFVIFRKSGKDVKIWSNANKGL